MRLFEDRKPVYGQDPYIVKHHDFYFLIESIGDKKIALNFLDSLASLNRTQQVIIWNHPEEYQVWAPEIHNINGRWYVYYASSNGDNFYHRNYVLSSDKLFGPYTFEGMLGPDVWGIDLTSFEWDGERYAVWSGWENNFDGFPQHLYIGYMPTPICVDGRVKISSPEHKWEKSHADINEAPQLVTNKDRLILSFSADASWTKDYKTGILELVGDDPLNPDHWQKNEYPLLFNTGHGCWVDDYHVYHRKMSSFPGWTDRELQSKKYSWKNGALVFY